MSKARAGMLTRNLIFKIIIPLLVTAFFALLVLSSTDQFEKEFENSKTELELSRYNWTKKLLESFEQKEEWLLKHGLMAEVSLFRRISKNIFQSATMLHFDRAEVVALSAFLIDLHFILLQLVFAAIAVWRLWLALAVITFVYAKTKVKAYKSFDLLGKTGNQRIYDSSIHLLANNYDYQLTGLACLKTVPYKAVKSSRIFTLLSDYNAINNTNLELLGIILCHCDFPYFLPQAGEVLDEFCCLDLQAEDLLYTTLNEYFSPNNSKANHVEDVRGDESIANYLNRINSDRYKAKIKDLGPKIISTLILSCICSRILSFRRDLNKWYAASEHYNLAARSVLFSVHSLSNDYSQEECRYLSQALTFAFQSLSFKRPDFFSKLEKNSFALRHLAELFLQPQKKYGSALQKIESINAYENLLVAWSKHFNEKCKLPEFVASLLRLENNLVVFPIDLLLSSLPKREYFKKLEESLRQAASSADKLNFIEIKEICRQHKIAEENLVKWSEIVNLLKTIGILAEKYNLFIMPKSQIVSLSYSELSQEHISCQINAAICVDLRSIENYLDQSLLNKIKKIRVHEISALPSKLKNPKNDFDDQGKLLAAETKS